MIICDEADFFENILGIKLLEFQKPIVKKGRGKLVMIGTKGRGFPAGEWQQ